MMKIILNVEHTSYYCCESTDNKNIVVVFLKLR